MSGRQELYSQCRECGESFQRTRHANGQLARRQFCPTHEHLKTRRPSPAPGKNGRIQSRQRLCSECGTNFEVHRDNNGDLSHAKRCPECRDKKRVATRRCSLCNSLFIVDRLPDGKQSQASVCKSCKPFQIDRNAVYREDNPDLREDYKAAQLPELPELPKGVWPAEGACFANPELWFSDVLQDQLAAQQACLSCPVLAQCRQLAQANPDHYGVWAGTLSTQEEIPE